jgi:hypothetical protein
MATYSFPCDPSVFSELYIKFMGNSCQMCAIGTVDYLKENCLGDKTEAEVEKEIDRSINSHILYMSKTFHLPVSVDKQHRECIKTSLKAISEYHKQFGRQFSQTCNMEEEVKPSNNYFAYVFGFLLVPTFVYVFKKIKHF